MRTVAVLALHGVLPAELSVPLEVFGRARLDDGGPAYRVVVAAVDEDVAAGPLRGRAGHGLDVLGEADTVVVPGVADPTAPVPVDVVRALRAAAARGARIASMSTSGTVIAAAGLLVGRRPTTHWTAVDGSSRRHPGAVVGAEPRGVDSRAVLTCTGAATGLDLCLHVVSADHGAAVAARAARLPAVPPQRHGDERSGRVAPVRRSPIDLGGLRDGVGDLVAAVIAAAESALDDDAPAAVRDAIGRQLRAVAPKAVPVIIDSLASGRPLTDTDLADFRAGGAAIAHEGVPLLYSLAGIGPALAVFTKTVMNEVADVPLSSRPLLLARAAQVTHRIAVEITAGWFAGRSAGTASAAPPAAPRDGLDDVDLAMLRLVVSGRSNDDIARATAYSKQTVRWRLSRLMRRWGVPNRAALAATAVRRGLVPHSSGGEVTAGAGDGAGRRTSGGS